jgi:membrane protein YqaA with SNARE-associated domain
MFHQLYQKVLRWSEHPHARWYLGGLSFAESSFFPIPPDVMLAPMVLATPKRWYYLAAITTIFSVLGGILGYFIGAWFIDAILPFLAEHGYQHHFDRATTWFKEWGVWVVFIAGFSPIPYKVFTIASGALSMAFLPFVIASFFGRAARFFLVAFVVYLSADKIQQISPQWIERIGWGTVVLAVIAYLTLH